MVSNKLLEFDNADVVDQVIVLLSHEKHFAREVSVRVLQRVEKIDDKHFPVITNALDNSENKGFKSRLIVAVASIESDRATEYVVNEFITSGWKTYYEVKSLTRLGDRAVPYIDEIINSDVFYGFSNALGGSVAPGIAVEKLIDHVFDDEVSDQSVIKSLSAIGRIGLTNRSLEKKILELQVLRPNIESQIFDQLFIDIGSEVAADVYLSKLKEYKVERLLLVMLDEMGDNPTVKNKVLEFLESDEKYLRVVVEMTEDSVQENFVLEIFRNQQTNELSLITTSEDGSFEKTNNTWILIDLLHDIGSNIKGNGVEKIGYEISKFLYSEDEFIQKLAINTLGDIGYEQAWSDVVSFLYHDNLNLAEAAIGFLEVLKVKDSLSDLITVSEKHWYPSIRFLSVKAIENINSVETDVDDSEFEEIIVVGGASNRAGFVSHEVEPCQNYKAKEHKANDKVRLDSSSSAGKLSEFSFDKEVVWFADSETEGGKMLINKELRGRIKSKPKFIDGTSMVEMIEVETRVPEIVFKHKDGWVMVTAMHWRIGGGLSFLNKEKEHITILDKSIIDAFVIGDKYYAVVGHGRAAGTTIYEVSYEEGEWSSHQWLVLPDSSEDAWLTSNGEIFLQTYESGIGIVLPQNRDFRMAECQ